MKGVQQKRRAREWDGHVNKHVQDWYICKLGRCYGCLVGDECVRVREVLPRKAAARRKKEKA